MMAPPQRDAHQSASASWANWCNQSVDTSFGFVKMAIRVGFSPLVSQDLYWSWSVYLEEPNGGNKAVKKLAVPAAVAVEAAVKRAELVMVSLHV